MVLIFDTAQHYDSYFAPLKPRIRFKSLDGSDTYFEFSGFAGSNPINCVYCDAERAVGETGVFNVIVEDSDNIINKDHLRNTKVYLDFGKTEATLKQFFIGFADIFVIRRPRSYYQEYLITGPSTRIQAAELFISRRQASNIQNIDDPKIVPDPNYNTNKIFKDSLSKRGWRPLDKEAIDDLTGWTDTSLIDSAVSVNFPVINEPLTPLWDFWDRLAQTAGAVWDIDYNTPDIEKVLLSYNPALHTGIIVKSGDLKTSKDSAEKVAYIKSNFDVEENASADSGTATRLYTLTIQDRVVIASSNKSTGSNTLNNRFIAQQINIQNDQRRITDFAFMLHKIGEPESPKSRVNGLFVMDDGANKPKGKTLAQFSIPISSIEESLETIFVNDVDVKIRFLEGSNKVWLILLDRSGIKGNVENDPANTIAWHHNNSFNTEQKLGGFTVYSATAPATESARDNPQGASWSSTNQGPTYTFSVLSNIRRLQARTNQQAAAKLRMKEAVIDSGFLSEPRSISSYLSLNLAKRAKARRGVQEVVVRVPNNFMFAPYQWISFNDGLSDTFQDLQVQRARIVVSALPGDPQIGALDMSITLAGLYNSLIGNCECQ